MNSAQLDTPWASLDDLIAPSADSELAVFSYAGVNLGDHIQTLALLQHVRANAFVPRDHPFSHSNLMLAANGWMTKGSFPTRRDFRDVRYLGIHIAPRLRTPETVEQLRGIGIIGCRDAATWTFLERHGVPASLCHCATLTFPRYSGPREHIVCVDVPAHIVRHVRDRFVPCHGEILHLTHTLKRHARPQLDDRLIQSQFERAYHVLGIYRTAALVVTSRIHVAMPCLAFGTPVIMFGQTDDRLSVLDGMGLTLGDATKPKWHHWWRAPSLPSPANPDIALWRQRYLDFLHQTLADLRGAHKPAPIPTAQAA